MKVKIVVLSSVIIILLLGMLTIQLTMENHDLKEQIYKKESLILTNIFVRKYHAINNESDVLMKNAVNAIDLQNPLMANGKYLEGSRGRYFIDRLREGGKNVQLMGENIENRVQIRDTISEMHSIISEKNTKSMTQQEFNEMISELIPLAEKYADLTK